MRLGGGGERGLPDQVVFIRRNESGIAAADADGEPVADGEATFEVDVESYAEGVKPGTEMSARAGNAKSGNGSQSVIIANMDAPRYLCSHLVTLSWQQGATIVNLEEIQADGCVIESETELPADEAVEI